MKAARYFDRGDIRIENVDEPVVEAGTVGIDVAWCGICGTDLHEYLDGPIFVPPAGHPHPVSGESAPITLGHEMSGTVYAVGEDVTDLKVGDNIVVEPYIIDPKESTEPGSNYHLTPNMNFIGLAGRGGGLGEKIVVERRWVHPIGDIALDEAALIEPLAVGYHAFVRSGAKSGDIALIGGAGPIGLLTAAVLKANGVTVIISELSELRRQKALDTGVADHALNPAEVDVVAEVKRLSGGSGADVAFECSSVNVVLDTLAARWHSAGRHPASRDHPRPPRPEEPLTMSNAVTLVTDDRNRVRAQMPVHLALTWISPDQQSRPRQLIAERVATHHLRQTTT